MNPLLSAALGSIIRTGLAIGAGWFVRKGIWTGEEATSYIAAASLGLIALVWSLFQKYWSRLDFLAALMSEPGATGADAKKLATTDIVPAASTPDTVNVHATSSSRSFMGTPLMVLLAATLAGSVVVSGCAKGDPNMTPERQVAIYGKQVADRIGAAQTLAKELNAGQVITNDQYKVALQVFIKVNAAGERLSDALLAYDVATTGIDQRNAAAQIDAALVTLGALLPDVFAGVTNDVARQKIGALVGEVTKLLVTIARFTAPSGAFLQMQETPAVIVVDYMKEPRGSNGFWSWLRFA